MPLFVANRLGWYRPSAGYRPGPYPIAMRGYIDGGLKTVEEWDYNAVAARSRRRRPYNQPMHSRPKFARARYAWMGAGLLG